MVVQRLIHRCWLPTAIILARASVTVNLFRAGAQIGQTTTGGDGIYRFAGLLPGPYSAREIQPAWLRFSTTPNEVTVAVTHGGEAIADFGDWHGRLIGLPLIVR